MKLSIWQQFSSNHSADFWIIGMFATIAEAKQTETDLLKLFERMKDWWKQLEHSQKQLWTDRVIHGDVSPIEVEIQKELGITWETGIDWFHDYWQEVPPITRFQNLIFLQPPRAEVWTGPQPFDSILESFGARVTRDVNESRTHSYIRGLANLSFDAPDEETATNIVTMMDEYFQSEFPDDGIPPWLYFYAREVADKRDTLLKHEYFHEQLQTILRENSNLISELERTTLEQYVKYEREARQHYKKKLREILEDQHGLREDWDENFEELIEYISAGMIQTNSIQSSVIQSHSHVVVRWLRFGDYGPAVEAIYNWLEHLGCTQIEFAFKEFEYDN